MDDKVLELRLYVDGPLAKRLAANKLTGKLGSDKNGADIADKVVFLPNLDLG